MIEQLYPCDHCGGRATLGRSQRVVEQDGYPAFDFTAFGRFSGPPKVGDVLARPLSAPLTEKLVCIYCSGCGMSTPWEPIGDDENTARDRVATIWNQRVNRPKVTAGDIRDLIEKELGAVDAQLVIGMLARNDTDWAERGPIFAMLAQRIVDAISARGLWHRHLVFDGEGHGFRKADSVTRSLAAEVELYEHVMGLTLDRGRTE